MCKEKAENVISVIEGTQASISQKLDEARAHEIAENRKRLIPIIKCVLFCGKYGLPLRGHRENIFEGERLIGNTAGIFKGLLQFRADAGDSDLRDHFEVMGDRSKYVSAEIQNDIIDSARCLMVESISQRVQRARYFSILADETTDCSTQEQFVNRHKVF